MKISDKLYDRLKVIALVVSPIVVFITALLNIWDVPYTAQLTASLVALETFIGAIVVALAKAYNKTVDNGHDEGTDENEV